MEHLPSLKRIREILGPETAFTIYFSHLQSKAYALGLLGLSRNIVNVHSKDPWGELLEWMRGLLAAAKDDQTRDEFQRSAFLYLERLEKFLARDPYLYENPRLSIWKDVLEGKYIPQDLTIDEIFLLDAVISDANPRRTLSSTLAKNRVLLKLEVPNKLLEHITKLVFVSSITALEAYLAATIISRILYSQILLRRFVEDNPEFKERKFPLSEVFVKFETIEEDVRKYLIKTLWHDLGRAKAIFESVFEMTFPNISELAKAVFKRHDLVHRNGFTTDGKLISVARIDVENLIKQIENFQQDLEAQLSTSPVK